MTKILIEGSGCIGDSCVANLTSTEWIFNRPSLMVWADNIYISEQDFSFLTSGYFVRSDSGISEDLAIFVEKMKSEGIAELFNPNEVLMPISKDSVLNTVKQDLSFFGTPGSEKDSNGKYEPPFIENGGNHFCPVALEGIYSSLLESRLLGCTCVMDPDKASFVFTRFGNSYPSSSAAQNVFDELYSVLVPELRVYHDYKIFCSSNKKESCLHGEDCTNNRRENIDKFFDDLMFHRENKDLSSLKSLIENKEQELGSEDAVLKRAVLKDISKAQKRLFDSYPNARKWMKFISAVSSSALAIISNSPTEALLPIASLIGLSQVVDASIEKLTEKERWKIGFCNAFIKK